MLAILIVSVCVALPQPGGRRAHMCRVEQARMTAQACAAAQIEMLGWLARLPPGSAVVSRCETLRRHAIAAGPGVRGPATGVTSLIKQPAPLASAGGAFLRLIRSLRFQGFRVGNLARRAPDASHSVLAASFVSARPLAVGRAARTIPTDLRTDRAGPVSRAPR